MMFLLNKLSWPELDRNAGLEQRTRTLLILTGLTLLAVITRVYGIWEWSITGDEYYTIAHAEERAGRIIGSAYYALVVGSTALFGMTEWSSRLPSVIMGVLGIPALYVLGKRLFNRPTALLACLLLVLSGWHVYHSQLARFYSGVVLFGILSYWLYYEALRKDNYMFLGGALLANLMAVMFNATAIMIPAACGLFSLIVLLWPSEMTQSYSKRVARVYVLVGVVAGLALLPRLLSMAQGWGGNFEGVSFDTLTVFLGLADRVTLIVGVAALFGVFYLYRVDRAKAILLMVAVGIPLLGLLLASLFLPPVRPRYVIYTLPLFLLLAAFLCIETRSLLPEYRLASHAMTAVVILALLPGLLSFYTGRVSLDIKDPIAFVEASYSDGDVIVTFGPSLGHNFSADVQRSIQRVGSKSRGGTALEAFADSGARTWIIVDTYRTTYMPRDLEAWLMENASLAWRKHETRFDYSMRGYEVWVVNGP